MLLLRTSSCRAAELSKPIRREQEQRCHAHKLSGKDLKRSEFDCNRAGEMVMVKVKNGISKIKMYAF